MTAQEIIEEYPLNALGFREMPSEIGMAMMLARLAMAQDKPAIMTEFERGFVRGFISPEEWNAIRYFNLAIA